MSNGKRSVVERLAVVETNVSWLKNRHGRLETMIAAEMLLIVITLVKMVVG